MSYREIVTYRYDTLICLQNILPNELYLMILEYLGKLKPLIGEINKYYKLDSYKNNYIKNIKIFYEVWYNKGLSRDKLLKKIKVFSNNKYNIKNRSGKILYYQIESGFKLTHNFCPECDRKIFTGHRSPCCRRCRCDVHGW